MIGMPREQAVQHSKEFGSQAVTRLEQLAPSQVAEFS